MWILEEDLIRRGVEEKILRKDSRGNWQEVGTRIVPTGIPIARIIKKEQATLIAAAPELLKALENLLEYASEEEWIVSGLGEGFEQTKRSKEAYELARAAISKAKGV